MEPAPVDSGKAAKSTVERAKEDPEAERWAAFWKRYEKASLDEKLSIAKETIENEPELDGELAFDLVESLCSLQRHGRVTELDDVIDMVEKRHPDAFAAEAYWFNLAQGANHLAQGGAFSSWKALCAAPARQDYGSTAPKWARG